MTTASPPASPALIAPPPPRQYPAFSRILHWLMAAMVLTMLGIGVAMVASLGDYHRLISIHRPLGICIFLFVIIRFINRRLNPPPPFPPTMSAAERKIATASERLLYTLMFVLPLVGWGMLSAGGYPIALLGPIYLPAILPHNAMFYAVLRKTHTILAYLLFLTFLAHISAVLFHTFIIRDHLFTRMAPWNVRRPQSVTPPAAMSD
jgi:cytochrome b561